MQIVTLAREPTLTNEVIEGMPGKRLSTDEGLIALVERELLTRPYKLVTAAGDKRLIIVRFASKQGHDSLEFFYEVQEQGGPGRDGGFSGYFMRDGRPAIRVGEKQTAHAFLIFPGMDEVIYKSIFDVLGNADRRLFAYSTSAEIKYPFELHGVQLKVDPNKPK